MKQPLVLLAALAAAAPDAMAAGIELTEPADTALAVDPEWEGQALFVADLGQSPTLFLDTVAASATPPECG